MLVRKSHEDASKRSFNQKTIYGSYALVPKALNIFFQLWLGRDFISIKDKFFQTNVFYFFFFNLIFKPCLA